VVEPEKKPGHGANAISLDLDKVKKEVRARCLHL
jgi:hypothetical protein